MLSTGVKNSGTVCDSASREYVCSVSLMLSGRVLNSGDVGKMGRE